MNNIIENLKWNIEFRIGKLKSYFHKLKYKMKYPNYTEDEYIYEDIQFIWGITSYDNISSNEANLYTMNDIDITYDRNKKVYMLGVETAYVFNSKQAECKYLRELLDTFTNFMTTNNYSIDKEYNLFFGNPCTSMENESIEELYTHFRIFVEGYCKLYDND